MDPNALTCPCSCHGRGMDAPCDWDGGCAHLHRPQVDQVDPHARRCARRGDCPGYQRVEIDDPEAKDGVRRIRIGAPLQQERGVCRVCRDVTASVIGKLEDDYWALYAELGAGQSMATDSDMVSGSRELPIPIRTSVRDLAARIVTVAVTWAEPVAEEAGMDWDAAAVLDHTRPHAALAKAVRVLRWNTARLVDHEAIEVRSWADNGYTTIEDSDGVDAAVELCRLHQRVEVVLGRTDLVHRLPAPCPRCDTMSLVRENGADNVHCSRCNVVYPESDYKRLTLVLKDSKPVAAA